MRRALLAVILCLSGAGHLWAGEPAVAAAEVSGLAWERNEISLVAEAGQERAEAVFPFRNRGSKPVTITGVESSCGCTTAKLKKNSFAPGESGEIRALFEFGTRTGTQQKELLVTTDEGAAAMQLVLRVTIPVRFAIEQRLVIWPQGVEPEARTVIVQTAEGVTVEKLTYDEAAVEASLAPRPEGGGYGLSVRLRSTAAVQRQTVMVHALVDGKPQALPVHLFVR